MDEHSLQSPFLFDVYQQALNPSRRKKVKNIEIEAIRKRLYKDSRHIEVDSLGSKSSLAFSRSKQISAIAKAGISDRNQSEILVNLLEYQSSKVILELGTSLGLNTIYMSQAGVVERVVTVDGNSELCEISQSHFSELEIQGIELINTDIDAFILETNETFDFVYMDANHTYEATKRYFSFALDRLSKSGTIVIDDINWSQEMKKAWLEIQQDYSDHVYIENDKIGIVFANVKSLNGNYILRF